MIFRLDPDSIEFPDPTEGDPDGLFAVGGDLSPERLMLAYSLGIFPWFSFRESDEPWWYCPMQRFVIFPDEIHVSHSMRNLMNKGNYTVTFNKDFKGVIEGCSEERIDMEGAWLGRDMIEAYTRLHELGFATSVEVWKGEELVGGLYGVTIGTAFCGESMFSRVPAASKLALIHLARKMESKGALLIDCQFETPHLKSMGGRHIPYFDYLRLLRAPLWLR
ncbi:MAG: leucyl/phenylalanyl-tRNA--protein transferase [Muribaculaceae bacterium]|nr:leucyl/phenylalanyl-tRNA--protein transferase [Muribaculaceae bacterium]